MTARNVYAINLGLAACMWAVIGLLATALLEGGQRHGLTWLQAAVIAGVPAGWFFTRIRNDKRINALISASVPRASDTRCSHTIRAISLNEILVVLTYFAAVLTMISAAYPPGR